MRWRARPTAGTIINAATSAEANPPLKDIVVNVAGGTVRNQLNS